jgi:hypothetical protein
MITWMQHIEHGKYPAQQSEIEALELSGWTICPPKVKQAVEQISAHKTQGDDHIALIKSVISESFAPPVRDKIRGNRRGTR